MNEEDKNIEKEEIKVLLVELISLQKEQLNLSKETHTLVKKIHDFTFDKKIENANILRSFCLNVIANIGTEFLFFDDEEKTISNDKLNEIILKLQNYL